MSQKLSRMYLSRLQTTRGLHVPVVHAPVCHRGPEVTYHEKRLSRMYCTVQYLCGLQTTRGLPVVHAPVSRRGPTVTQRETKALQEASAWVTNYTRELQV
jgi:hypothetical protein